MKENVIIGGMAIAVTGIALAGCGSSHAPAAKRAAQPKTQAPPPAAAPQEARVKATNARFKLQEFRPYRGHRGFFYTANTTEAANAKNNLSFTQINHNLGAISAKSFKNAITLYRLKYKPFPSYLVTASTAERDKLVRSGHFVYEGVMGFAAPLNTNKAGKVLLWRVARNSEWRLVTDSERSKVGPGWHLDGRIGYAWKTA